MDEREAFPLYSGEGATPETVSPDEQLLLYKYYKDVYPYQYLLDSFNRFVNKDIATCLSAFNIELPGERIVTVRLSPVINPPEHEVNGLSYKLDYKEALLTGKSYSIKIRIYVEIKNKMGKITKSQEAVFFNLPIMIYSDYCHSKNALTKTEWPADPGCYFIVNGLRNVILLFEKARQYQYMLHTDKDKHTYPYVSQISETPTSSSQTSIHVNQATNKTITIGVRLNKYYDQEKKESTEEKIPPAKKDKDINVIDVCYIISLLLSKNKKKTTRKEMRNKFISLLKTLIPPNHFFKCWSTFQQTLADYDDTIEEKAIMNFAQALELSLTVGIDESEEQKKVNENIRRAKMKEYITNKIFPIWPDFEHKINMIVAMTARLLQCINGYVKLTNKDHWGTKGLSAPGEILRNIFIRKFKGVINKTKENPKSNKANTTADEILTIILDQNFETKFLSEFRGLPNKKAAKAAMSAAKSQSKAVKAVAQDASPLNSIDLRSMLTKTRSNAPKTSSSFKLRSLEGSMWRFICSFKATEGSKCGITKFLASTTTITIENDPYKVMDTLLNNKYQGVVIVSKEYNENYSVPVTLNGLLIGYVNAIYGYKNLVMLKRFGEISRKTCIVVTTSGVIEIYVDAQRLMVPVVTIDEGTGLLKIYSSRWKDIWKKMTFTQLLDKGLVEYLDNYEIENPTINVAETFSSFDNYKRELENINLIIEEAIKEGNTIYQNNAEKERESIIKGRPNYANMHPIAAYGVTSALLSFSNLMAACRVAFNTKMDEQAIHFVLNDPHAHINMYNAAVGTNASIASSVYQIMGLEKEISGQTMVIAMLSTYMNQEDSAIISKTAIDFGKLRYVERTVFKETDGDSKHFGRIVPVNVSNYRFRHITEKGVPATGVELFPGDCVIGKYEEIHGEGNVIRIEDRSVYLERDEAGVVKEVITYYSVKSGSLSRQLTISVILERYARTGVGDKISTPHAQKYIISQIRAGADMPFSITTGTPVDAMFNALCFPTRMTVGTMLEPLIHKRLTIDGKTHDSGAHQIHNTAEIKDTLMKNGYAYSGKETLIDGRTGRKLKADIFVGPGRIRNLAHIAKHKIQCRATGKMNILTGQAESGKTGSARDKGQKTSEHEKNQFIKYGASFLIQERMNLSCDAFTVVTCKICSSYASYDPLINKFKCNVCGSAGQDETCRDRFGKFIMPRTSIYLQTLMMSMGVNLKSKFVSKEEFLKEGNYYNATDETATGFADEEIGDDEGEGD